MIQTKTSFKAFRVEEEDGKFECAIKELAFLDLKDDEIRVRVHYSSLNYKDALSAIGNKGVTSKYPHTPGIDAVGEVVESTSALFEIGAKVIVTSYDLGMNTDGGFAEYIQVPAAWAVSLPDALTMHEAMIFGTAGLTAGMSVLRLTELVEPEHGLIAVSGATGGVGAMSISILSKLGYQVVAITSKETERDYLYALGAKELLLRKDIENFDKKPLLKPLFAGAIDAVGGVILENMIKATKPMGVVTCCGNVASAKLDLTVFPFILRGVSLIGIDSQNYAMKYRLRVWDLLAKNWKPDNLLDNFEEIGLSELKSKIDLMLEGKLKGRTIVKIIE